MGGVTYIPGQQVEQLDIQDKYTKLMQMGMAVQQSKKAEAVQTIEQGFKLMDMGIDPDYDAMQRAAKTAGFPLPKDPKSWAVQQQGIQQAAANPTAAPTPGVDPNQAAGVGGATQGNKAGLQAGTPPSTSAANKAPGGGVITPNAVPTQTLQKAVAGSIPGVSGGQQGGGPQYAQTPMTPQAGGGLRGFTESRRQGMAVSAIGSAADIQKKQAEAEHAKNVAELSNKVRSSDPKNIDFKDIGKLMAMQGQNITPEMAKYGEMNSSQKSHMLDIAAGMEEEMGTKLQRESSFRAAMLTNPQTLRMVARPQDAPRLVESILSGNGFPTDIAAGQNLDNLVQRADLFQKYAGVIGDVSYAAKMADAASIGGNPLDVLPEGIRGVAELQIKNEEERTKAMQLSANADWLNAQSNARQATIAANKADEAAMTDPILADALKTYKVLAEAKKAGAAVDEKMFKALQETISQRSGWTKQEKQGMVSKAFWGSWDWLAGSSETTLTPANPEQLKGMTGGKPTTPKGLSNISGMQAVPAH
jgi:hypothetical protein